MPFRHRDRMDLLQQKLWEVTLLVYLSGLLQWDVCVGQRVVETQMGPLFRVKGYTVTISCNVSGFRGPPQQNFEFSIFGPSQQEVKIISTSDPNIAYARYSRRVREGDINITRISGSSVLLYIKTLREEDTGEYECYTPSTDPTYYGSYSARTKLNVIQDSLVASSSPDDLRKHEGDSLQLQCEVSSQTFQHTHLSVTWFLQSDQAGPPRPIITLARDFTVSPGDEFKERYSAGHIGLVKLEETTYRLSITQLQLSDQGSVYCEASEWIQDPDRSWYRIAQKKSKASDILVQPSGEISDANTFSTRIEAPKWQIQEGDVFVLTCAVDAQNIVDRYFSVAWLKDNKEVARIGPTGVPSMASDYKQREGEGEVKVLKHSDRDYLLTIRLVRAEDGGQYQCRVWEEVKTEGSFTQQQSQESSVQSLSVTVTGSNLAVSVLNPNITINEGDVLQVTCRVSGAHGQVSVSWQQRSRQGTFIDMISLSHAGVMTPGSRYLQKVQTGDVRIFCGTPDSFTLEIANTLPSDAGTYKCTVSEWVTETNGNTRKMDSKSQESTVYVHSLDSLIRADLKSRNVIVRELEAVELICRVKGPKIPLSVTWKFQQTDSPSQEEIVSVLYTGVITWQRERRNYQLRTLVQEGETIFGLRVFRASKREAGKYQCMVEAFLRQTQRLSKLSNELAVVVRKPESRLSVSISPPSPVERAAGTDLRVDCAVLTATSNSSRFAVSWLFHPEGEKNRTLLSVDRDSVLGPSAGDKYSLRRLGVRSYQLLLQRAETGDSGRYICRVEEWLQDSHGEWYSLPSQSAAMELIISSESSHVSVLQGDTEITVGSGEQLNINCTMDSSGWVSKSLYSVTWFFTPENSSPKATLAKISHDSVLEVKDVSEDRLARMHFYKPTIDTFRLTIQNADEGDSGQYSCQVDEFQLKSNEGSWLQTATDQSGFTIVSVQQIGSHVSVLQGDTEITVGSGEQLNINCTMDSSGWVSKSLYSVTWFFTPENSSPKATLAKISHDSVLEVKDVSEDRLARMHFYKPTIDTFRLTIQNADEGDSGQYSCQVDEFQLKSNEGSWLQTATDQSGFTIVSVQQIGSHVSVLQGDTEITVGSGEQLNINCTMDSSGWMSKSLYSVTWFFTPENSFPKTTLAKISHDSVLEVKDVSEERLARMHFYKPTIDTFRLTIQNADEGDSGQYSCQVDEFQLKSNEGSWLQTATNQSGFTIVSVQQIGTPEPSSSAGWLLSVYPCVIAVLILVVVFLIYKIRRAGHSSAPGRNSQANSLWAESNPLKPVPEA
ncbi:immunoglobulin superfamily member 3-like [Megalops cyprinoides]|uniref:immunoglobulin superfamily member 3-like n=1 Tax=Megalops cyprinoides TaxID=118141 RepID=UPI0018648D85|nr:immunoglobulin superfamily member 3-like [Megalops cyprinoides]